MDTQLPIDYYGLVEAFGQPGCAVCHLMLQGADRFMDSLLYEQVNESQTQHAVRRRRGLCNEHAWQLAHYTGDALGIAILYRAATDEVLKVIAHNVPKDVTLSGLARLLGAPAQQDATALADALAPEQPCMVCDMLGALEQRALATLSQFLSDEHLLAAYRSSDGLCLAHFRLALRHVHDPVGIAQMTSIQEEIWSKLKANLQTFIDKNDYRRMREPMGAEKESWQQALRAMAGERGIFGVEIRRPGKEVRK
jgi:hypothetical protein